MAITKPEALKYRYPGIKPFTSDEQPLFFGRDQDIENLYSLIFVKQIVVLYGKSGQGKSSLINAGIIPKLDEEKTFTYFNIRLINYSKKEESNSLSPVQTVSLKLGQNIDHSLKVHSLIDTILPNEDSFWYWIKKLQTINSDQKKFILFFDQFEELFTYPNNQIEEFSLQLSDLLYNTIPVRFRQRISEMDDKNEINEDLHDTLYDKPEIKVVFSIRSDRISLINHLAKRHPAILQNCYELESLNRNQVWNAINKPALIDDLSLFITPTFTYTDDAINKIIAHITNEQDDRIDLATLQIICRYIEDQLVNQDKIREINSEILGDIKKIFTRFYINILSRLNENDLKKAQQLIEEELLEGGRRNPLSLSYIQTKFNIEEKLLLFLESTSLLRKEMDAEGRILIELSHDALTDPILSEKANRKYREEVERKNRELQEQRRIENEINTLRKARELEKLDKKAFHYIKTEALKKQSRFHLTQIKLKTLQDNSKKIISFLLLMLFFVVIFIWSVIATYKLVNKSVSQRKYKNQVEKINIELRQYLNTCDSIKNPVDYRELNKIYKNLNDLENSK
jgi:energy-coupling factor transporter ATP-binding protein EcfA2